MRRKFNSNIQFGFGFVTLPTNEPLSQTDFPFQRVADWLPGQVVLTAFTEACDVILEKCPSSQNKGNRIKRKRQPPAVAVGKSIVSSPEMVLVRGPAEKCNQNNAVGKSSLSIYRVHRRARHRNRRI